jgi:ATP synthase protein I
MSDPDQSGSLEDLGARIARERQKAGLDAQEKDADARRVGSGLGMAWRLSIEFVTATVVAAALGWALDRWLGTTPWLMLLLLVLGGAAGVRNMVRTANRMDAEAAETRTRGADGTDGGGRRRT